MRIKQIELTGFKSFMDRTVLELPPGITGIVGPNGCGKSNVVDAIRWVLGEQSPKHLRGGSMEDVIFNGNAENGPLGMAEVSMLLERDDADFARAAEEANDDEAHGGLPPELARASEILVTRRYFRSGDSEYFINRAPCRLKDITELFLGTGVGSKAYAIVEQGRVDQLVNAKPEDMRSFIEEAAGTTRFRSRKLAAERKMMRTRENLLRVQDVLREIERQMTLLERQARRAEEYHRLKGELRELDLGLMAGRQQAWSQLLDEHRSRIETLQADETAAQDEIRRSRGASSEAHARRAADEDRLRQVERLSGERRMAAHDAAAQSASARARQHDMTVRAGEAEREVERLAARIAELEAEAAALAAEVERLSAEHPEADGAHHLAAERLQALAATGPELERVVEVAKDLLVEALADEARLHNVAEALRQRHADLVGRRQKLADEQRQLGERLREADRRGQEVRGTLVAIEEDRARANEQRQQAIDAQESLRAAARDQDVALDEARAELTRLDSRAESLRELQIRYEGCTRGVASLLARPGDGAALLASVLRVPADLERAVAAALGGRLGQVVVADTGAAVESVAWLTSETAGSATLVPRESERRAPVIVPPGPRLLDRIDVDPPHWALAEALLGHVLLADDLDGALRLWREAPHPVLVVTRRGEAIDTVGAVTGGSEPPLEETLLARTRELRELEQARAGASARVAELERQVSETRGRLANCDDTIASADATLHALDVSFVAAEKDRDGCESERRRIVAELEVAALEAGGLEGQGGEVEGERAQIEQRLAAAEQLVAERRGELVTRQLGLSRWREEYAAVERQRTEAAVRAAAIAERLHATQTQVARGQAAVSELKERRGRALDDAAECRSAAEAARVLGDESVAQQQAAEVEAGRLDEEAQRLLAAIAEANRTLSADDASEQAARAQLEEMRAERAGIELALTERRMALERLATQLAERYGLTPDALSDVAALDADDEERDRRAETIRERLQRLGEVNPAALTDLEELRTRRDFLVSQRDDLERSLEDLKRTIGKLTRTSRERFDATFNAANEKLTEVFPKLFPGGKARLELTAPEEGGEAGVEIVVQPSGKKLQSLSLLSGGEKALTAAALILSLFLIRPTPFCLLDEVDAPLDEANIGRFNQLVRDMAAASQFVLITHNRRTMEAADTLYGITMEQAGISKVVSVRLREAA
jgi:chromosome segregation protein